MTNAELLTKIRAEIERRLECITTGLDYTAEIELNGILSFLSTLESEKPMNPDDAMKKLDEKIALVKQSGTWDGVDVDKYMDEIRGREPEKPMDLEEEISRTYHDGSVTDTSDLDHVSYENIARHFAEWGYLRAAEKYNEIEYNRQRAEESVPKDLEEAADEYEKKHTYQLYDGGVFTTPEYDATPADAFIVGANWQKQHDAELIEIAYNDGITIGMTKQKEQMMNDYPKWRRIKAGERSPCPAYVWTIAYDNYPDCFEGRLMPNIQGVKVGLDTWYLPVDVIHNLPKED